MDDRVVVLGGHLIGVDESGIMRGAERRAWRLLRGAGVRRLLERARRLGQPLLDAAAGLAVAVDDAEV